VRFSGLFDPNTNKRVAGYVFDEFKFSETTKAQISGRIEHVNLKGTMPNFPPDFLPDGSELIPIPRNPSSHPRALRRA
jgi:iron complex outermembrane receptor protein